MLKLEGPYISEMGDNAVNKCVPGPTQAETHSKRHEKNKDTQCKRVAEYYVKNRESFLEKHTCDVCGGTYTKKHKAQHCTTKKHLRALDALPDEVVWKRAYGRMRIPSKNEVYLELKYECRGSLSNYIFNHIMGTLLEMRYPVCSQHYMDKWTIRGCGSRALVEGLIEAAVENYTTLSSRSP